MSRRHDDVLHALARWDVVGERGARQSDADAEVGHVDLTEAVAQHCDGAFGRVHACCGESDEGGLASAVRPQEDPTILGVNGPVDAAQDGVVVAAQRHAAHVED